MYLFNYTKGYFESWVKLLISFMLQPMVAIVFMTTMLSVYDFGFYGTCKYDYKEIAFSGPEMQMTTLNGALGTYVPGDNGGGRAIRYYYLDNDWTKYANDEEKNGCINSLGFILNNPMAWFQMRLCPGLMTLLEMKRKNVLIFLMLLKVLQGCFLTC